MLRQYINYMPGLLSLSSYQIPCALIVISFNAIQDDSGGNIILWEVTVSATGRTIVQMNVFLTVNAHLDQAVRIYKNKSTVNGNKDKLLLITAVLFQFKSKVYMTNLLQFKINVPKSHRPPQ